MRLMTAIFATVLVALGGCRTGSQDAAQVKEAAQEGGAKTSRIQALKSEQTVTLHYQSTYLSGDQLGMIAPEVANEVDASTGQSVAQLLSADRNGIPSLSHTWLEAVRTIHFMWNGKPEDFRQSYTISWLPASETIAPESSGQVGANYSLEGTDAFMTAAASGPVAELGIVASRIRTDGPSKGWARAFDEHPILDRPLLGAIPRQIAANKIAETIEAMASTVDAINASPRLIVDRGELPPVAVSEEAFLAIKARSIQLGAGIDYSMFVNDQKVALASRQGATNCSGAAADLLAGGASDFGPVPFLDFGVSRGLAASSAVAEYYGKYGPSYKMDPAVMKQYLVDRYLIGSPSPRAGAGKACTCADAPAGSDGPSCDITLANGKRYDIAGPCQDNCAAAGNALPLLVANCTSVTID